jgi:hypothetical protein
VRTLGKELRNSVLVGEFCRDAIVVGAFACEPCAEVRKRGSLGFVVETFVIFFLCLLDLSVMESVQCGRVFDTCIRW